MVVELGELPSDIRFYVDTINLIYELSLRYGTPWREEVVFHLELGLWYWNFFNYQGSKLIRYRNYQRLKQYKKDKLILWEEVRGMCLNCYLSLCSNP